MMTAAALPLVTKGALAIVSRHRLEKFGMRHAPERLLDRLPTTALIISTTIPIR
jgi:hypothetical protein